MLKRLILALMFLVTPVMAKPTILFTSTSKCRLSIPQMMQMVYDAGFTDNQAVMISGSMDDWKRWTENTDTQIFSKSRVTFVRCQFLESTEAPEALKKEAKRGTHTRAN